MKTIMQLTGGITFVIGIVWIIIIIVKTIFGLIDAYDCFTAALILAASAITLNIAKAIPEPKKRKKSKHNGRH